MMASISELCCSPAHSSMCQSCTSSTSSASDIHVGRLSAFMLQQHCISAQHSLRHGLISTEGTTTGTLTPIMRSSPGPAIGWPYTPCPSTE